MNKLAIPLFLLSAACSFSCFAPPAHSAEGDETWYITPRYGFSMSTGMFGVEIQVGNVAVGGGIPLIAGSGGGCQNGGGSSMAYGAKYYFSGTTDSWSLGLFSFPFEDRFNGISVEYRWHFESGWDLSAGMGYGKDRTYTGTLPSFAAGYSF